MSRQYFAACAFAMSMFSVGPALAADGIPAFRVDTAWPQPLPSNWILGQVSGVATDADDHIWVLQRPASEHGIHVDLQGFVWITGNGPNDGQILKFTRDGKFVLQIGKVGPQTGNADTTRLGQAATAEVDAAGKEVYVADGYHNRRIIVFDAATGAYRRHWGAYGKPPVDVEIPNFRRSRPPTAAQLQTFANPVHCARLSKDGMVYVCDRLNNRVQVFKSDGTFVKEFSVEPATTGLGSVWDIAMSRDAQQRYLFLADGRNNQVMTLSRDTGAVLSQFGQSGRHAGEFHWVHDLAIDSHGNLYAGEVDTGRRVQRFLRLP